MSNIFKKLYNKDGTVDYVFNQQEFNKIIVSFINPINPLIKYIKEFCELQETNNISIIGTKENLKQYEESIKEYFKNRINLNFIYTSECFIDKNKIIIINNDYIKPINFKYEFKSEYKEEDNEISM